jgi:hypothetical protein
MTLGSILGAAPARLEAAPLTVDGSLTDWGFQVADNNGSTFLPDPGLNLLGLAVEDQDDLAGDDGFLGPYWGGQNYDAEALAAAVQGANLFIAIVSGQRPDNGLTRYAPADIQITTDAAVYRIEVGGGVGGGSGGAIVENAAGTTYGIDGDGWSTGTVSTPLAQQAGTIWANSWVIYYNQLQIPGATKIGTADYVFTRNSVTTQHSMIELSLPLNLFGSETILGIDWAAACDNDKLELNFNVPEPSTLALAGAGLCTVMAACRRGRRAAIARKP